MVRVSTLLHKVAQVPYRSGLTTYLFKCDVTTADIVIKACRLFLAVLSENNLLALSQPQTRVDKTAKNVRGECLNENSSRYKLMTVLSVLPHFNIKTVFPCRFIPIIKIRRSSDLYNGYPILARRTDYQQRECIVLWLFFFNSFISFSIHIYYLI